MAVVNITNTKAGYGSTALTALAALTSATDGALVNATGNMLLNIKNNGAAVQTFTIKKGNGIQGVSDLTVSVAAGATHTIIPETGKYKSVTGTNKGKIHIVGSTTDIQIQAIELP